MLKGGGDVMFSRDGLSGQVDSSLEVAEPEADSLEESSQLSGYAMAT
jgi:hypothetical protein